MSQNKSVQLDEYNAAFSLWLREHEEWVKSSRSAPLDSWWTTCDAFVDCAVSFSNVPEHHKESIIKVIEDRTAEKEYESIDPDKQSFEIPGNWILGGLNGLINAQPYRVAVLEEPREVVKLTGISVDQISKMYGVDYYTAAKIDTEARNGKLLKEMTCIPKNYKSPQQRDAFERSRKIRTRWNRACSMWVEWKEFVREDYNDWSPPPESIEDLISQGVSTDQISLMWREHPETIETIRRGMQYRNTHVSTGDFSDEDDEEENVDVDAEILKAHNERPDWSQKQIAEALGVSATKVSRVIRKANDPTPAL